MDTQPYLIFELGNLQVYTMQPPSFLGLSPAWQPGDFTDNFYWRDPAAPQGYGPFKHVTGCIEHYKWVLETCRSNKILLTGKLAPIVRIDFKTKKVIKDTTLDQK